MRLIIATSLLCVCLYANFTETDVNRFNNTRNSQGEVTITVLPNGEIVTHDAEETPVEQEEPINKEIKKQETPTKEVIAKPTQQVQTQEHVNNPQEMQKLQEQHDILFFIMLEKKQARENFKNNHAQSFNYYKTSGKQEVVKAINTNNNDNNQVVNEKVIKGVCQFNEKVEVTSDTKTVLNNCIIDNKYAEVVLTLIPTEKKLIARIESILIDDVDKIFDKELSMVLNNKASQDNIATFVNTRKNENNLNVAKKHLAGGASNAINASFEQLKESNTNSSRTVDANGNSIVVTNTEKPDIVENMAYGLGDGAVKIIQELTELSYEKLPYKFLIEKDTQIKLFIKGMK